MAKTFTQKNKSFIPIGWREWVIFPEHDDFPVKAKIDTGARSSALHATHIKEYSNKGIARIKFRVYQAREFLYLDRKIIDYKNIKNSFGDSETRPVIQMKIKIGNSIWKTEITLTRRTRMVYPMLIGRNSLTKKHVIHSHRSYLTGNINKNSL